MSTLVIKKVPPEKRRRAKAAIRKYLEEQGLLGRVISMKELKKAVDDLFGHLLIYGGTNKFDPPDIPPHLRVRYKHALDEVTHVPNIENYPRVVLASYIAEQPENAHLFEKVGKKVESHAKQLRDELANSGLIINAPSAKAKKSEAVEELSKEFIEENADAIREAMFHNIGVSLRNMPEEILKFGMEYYPKLHRSLNVLGDMTNTDPVILSQRLAASSGRNNWTNNFNALLLMTAFDDLLRRGRLIPAELLRPHGISADEALLLTSPTKLVKSMGTNFPEVAATFVDASPWDVLGRSALKKRSFSKNSVRDYTIGTYDAQHQSLNLGRPAMSPETPHMYMLAHDTTRDAYRHFLGIDPDNLPLFHGINSARWHYAQTYNPTAPGSKLLREFIPVYEDPSKLVKLYGTEDVPPEVITLKRRPRKKRR